jgi:pantothenate kinase
VRPLLLGTVALLASTAGASTQVHYVMGTFLRVVVDDDVPRRISTAASPGRGRSTHVLALRSERASSCG